VDDLVKIFAVNRNAIVLIDSDKTNAARPVNDTKKRIASEIEQLNVLAWITKGREVENYLPAAALDQLHGGLSSLAADPYADIAEVLDKHAPGEGKKFAKSKVLSAERLLPFITKEGLCPTLDLGSRLRDTCTRIGLWNGIRFESELDWLA
jgi:hypothetical protein